MSQIFKAFSGNTSAKLSICAFKDNKEVSVLTRNIVKLLHHQALWVPGHSGIANNRKIVELAKTWIFECERIAYLLSSCFLALDQWTSLEFSSGSTTRFFATAKPFWSRVERKRFIEPLALGKVHLAAEALTRRFPINIHHLASFVRHKTFNYKEV